ncbi:PAS domain S-box protein [bacterium]|nr:MAG: PAS domain S-box protein [bacterium]
MAKKSSNKNSGGRELFLGGTRETGTCDQGNYWCMVFETAIDGMFVIDMQGRYKDVNHAGCRMFGYTKEEFLKSDVSLLLFPEDVADAFERGKTVWRTGRLASEVRMKKKDGGEIWIEMTSNPFTLGGIEYCLGVKRDITASKKQKEELVNKIKERTDELLQANAALRSEIEDRQRMGDVLRAILEGTQAVAGDEFLHLFVKNLASATGLRCAFISELTGAVTDPVRILAMWDDGKFVTNIQYYLKDTPCEQVVAHKLGYYPQAVKKLFPNDHLLVEMGIDSYIGVLLNDSSGATIGILAVMDDKPMSEKPDLQRILSIFASRAALELQRKRAEEALNKTNAMLSAILDNSQAVIYLKDEAGRFVFVNKHYDRLFNKSKQSLVGKTDYDLFPKEFADVYRANDKKVVEANSPCEFEETAMHSDGVEHTYISLKFTIPSIQGSLCGISTDITEIKRVSEALKKSEKLLKDAQCVAKMGSWERDLSTNKITWSDEVYDIFGVSPGEFDGDFNALIRCIHPDDRERVKQVVSKTVQDKVPYTIDYRIVTPEKKIKTLHVYADVILDASGKAVRLVGTAQDVTEIRKMQEEAIKAQKLETIGTLAGGIAHDFNNLLVGVLGNVGIAKKYINRNDKAFEVLGDIEKAALRARGLTKKLLTFSSGGEPVMEAAPIDGLIHNTAAFAIKDSGVLVDCALPKELWHAVVDEGQIAQVINNVVMNAVYAMDGAGVIHISADNVEVTPSAEVVAPLKPGRYVLVSVKDTGCGIPENNLTKIFDPFFTTKTAGSGLGLAVSYSIVKKHNGAIIVDSSHGKGTTVRIYLPAAGSAVVMENVSTEVFSSGMTGKGRVLVMDDEDVVREVSGEMLTILGYEPDLAPDGEQAVMKYKEAMTSGKPYVFVILDLTVPGGLGGKDTVKQLLSIDPNASVIVSSGYSNDPIMADYDKYGFKGVVSKPYTISMLGKVIKGVFGNG